MKKFYVSTEYFLNYNDILLFKNILKEFVSK